MQDYPGQKTCYHFSMTGKHKCPDCRCTLPVSRALEFEPDLDTWLTGAVIPTGGDESLTMTRVYTAYIRWCHGRGLDGPRISSSRLTRHLRSKGYRFSETSSSANRLEGYRLR